MKKGGKNAEKGGVAGGVAGVVLAAGMSVRMGEFKPLMKLGGEMLVRRVIKGLWESGEVGRIVVVTGHRAGDVGEAVRGMKGVKVVVNERYREGEMLSSVVAGMKGVIEGEGEKERAESREEGEKAGTREGRVERGEGWEREVGLEGMKGVIEGEGEKGRGEGRVEGGARGVVGVVVAFADQPAVKAETVGRLVREFRQCGAPVVLPVYGGRRGHPIVISVKLVPEILKLGDGETLRTVIHRHMNEIRLVEVGDAGVAEDLDTPEDWKRAGGRGRRM